jgi:hypothetical protein
MLKEIAWSAMTPAARCRGWGFRKDDGGWVDEVDGMDGVDEMGEGGGEKAVFLF